MEMVDLNSKIRIQEIAVSGQLDWKWSLDPVFARLFFALLAQTLVASLFFHGSPSPFQSAVAWWPDTAA